MAATESTMLALGTACPDFHLPDPSGKVHARDDFASAPALVVMFLCNHCPYVKHVQAGLVTFARDYADKVAIVAISSNDVAAYPEDAPPRMAEESRRAGYSFPYLYDETQSVAKAFRAACTPDFYVFDNERRLTYRGQLDASRPGNRIPVTGADLRAAVDATLRGSSPVPNQKPSVGCNIKWTAGNAPDYFG